MSQQDKAREWWAVFEFTGYSFYRNQKDAESAAKKSKQPVIHVIEKSYADKLEAALKNQVPMDVIERLVGALHSIAAFHIGGNKLVEAHFNGCEIEDLVDCVTNDTLIARDALKLFDRWKKGRGDK